MHSTPVCVGLAVANAQLDVALRPSAAGWTVTNEDSGMATRVACWQARPPTRLGREATGGLAVSVTAALAAAGRPVVVVHPRQARACAKATGRLAQTERLDAHGLAHVAEAVRPVPRPWPEAPTQALSALLARRRPLVDRLTAEKTRLSSAPSRVRADLQAHSTGREPRLGDRTTAIGTAIRASTVWREHEALWHSPPGVGPGLARTLRADLPELGTLHRQAMAALVGGAPFNRASGMRRGPRTSWGGRAPVRAVRSMSTLVAVRHNPGLKAFYQRLCAAGKAPKIALTACMRKLRTLLHAMLTHRTPWQNNNAHSS